MDKVKLAIISHALVIPVNQARWKMLAEGGGYEVHLLIPGHWESDWFGDKEKKVHESHEIHEGNFHVHPLPVTDTKNWGKYLFKSIDIKFRRIKPDLIYIIHEESILIHHQIYLCRRLFAPKAKIIFFSMNARGIPYQNAKHPIKKVVHKWMWENIKKNTEAALVHYPGCLDSLRGGQYEKPIYIQTQVGVDETLFAPVPEKRNGYRKKTGFQGKLVIGYTGRLIIDKGVDDLLAVFIKLAPLYPHIALLLVGNGELRDEIELTAQEHNLTDRIHITGFVDQAEVPAYMNAMDIFVLGSKTMPHWIDTFPLVTVQAQAVGLPVIASDSGAMPWQLAESAMIFSEGDRVQLQEAITVFIENEEVRNDYAQLGRQRSLVYFCHQGMTENFIKIVEQVLEGNILYHADDKEYKPHKAY